MSTISGISNSGNWAMMQGMRQPPDGKKIAEELFSKLDSSGQGYIDKSTLQSALGQNSSSSNVDELFAKLDTNSDGKVTKDEFTSTLDDLASQMKRPGSGNGMPPPPPQNDAGFTKEELTTQLNGGNSTDGKRTELLTKVIENFDKADTNKDGKVSFQEAMALEQSSSTASSTDSTGSTADAKIMRQLMQLMQTYGLSGSSEKASLFSATA